jgi:hypothetical protein
VVSSFVHYVEMLEGDTGACGSARHTLLSKLLQHPS